MVRPMALVRCDKQTGIGIVEGTQPLHDHPDRAIDADARVRELGDVFQKPQSTLESKFQPPEGGGHVAQYHQGSRTDQHVGEADVRATAAEGDSHTQYHNGRYYGDPKPWSQPTAKGCDQNGEKGEWGEHTSRMTTEGHQSHSPADVYPGLDYTW